MPNFTGSVIIYFELVNYCCKHFSFLKIKCKFLFSRSKRTEQSGHIPTDEEVKLSKLCSEKDDSEDEDDDDDVPLKALVSTKEKEESPETHDR